MTTHYWRGRQLKRIMYPVTALIQAACGGRDKLRVFGDLIAATECNGLDNIGLSARQMPAYLHEVEAPLYVR